jgi:hypothetical protein
MQEDKGDDMKFRPVYVFPLLILAALFLSGFVQAAGKPADSNYSVQAQETVVATEPPISTVISTVLVPVTGEDNTANGNTTMLVYILIGIAGLAFLVALVAILTRSNQAPPDHTHTR